MTKQKMNGKTTTNVKIKGIANTKGLTKRTREKYKKRSKIKYLIEISNYLIK